MTALDLYLAEIKDFAVSSFRSECRARFPLRFFGASSIPKSLASEPRRRLGMLQPTHLAALLTAACLAACLAGCGGYAMFDPDATASFTASPAAPSADKANAAALNSLFARAAESKPDAGQSAPAPAARPAEVAPAAKPMWVASADETANPAAEPAPGVAQKLAEEVPRGRAYLYRGIAGLIYSRGMDGLAERIRQAGIEASVSTYLLWRGDAAQAVRDYRRDPQPITLIGHSMGGDSALAFAEMLNAENIPVSLLVTYDPSRIADNVPPNVERYINIYQSSNVMGGGNVVAGSRFHGHYASYNLKNHREIIHINIEKAEQIQEQLVAKIRELATTPANAEGEAVPLRLELPADAAIELWDSALPVTAHAGDTLKALAANYRVPLWSLAEINSVSERAPLAEGQRIIVPRHLVPMAAASAVSSYAPTGH
jgi:pimeloyl-ACP methyl ester carboxylesterase